MTHAFALAGGLDALARPAHAGVAPRDRLAGAVLVGVGVVLSAGALAASLASDAPLEVRALAAFLNALIILVPIGVGRYAARRESHRRFGRQLIAAGFISSTAALAQADLSLPYSIAMIGGWLVILIVVFLVLSYPSGRLATNLDRGLFAAAVLLVCVLYLPTALLVDGYPAQTPWSSCRVVCPANALMLVDEQPAFIDAWLVPAREAFTVAVLLGVLGTLAGRVRRATYLERRTLTPVLVAAAVMLKSLAVWLVAHRTSPDAPAVDMLGWLFALCIPALAIGFLVGLMRWQVYVAHALERLTVAMRRQIAPEELRNTLARA